jgi:hypothetical protein
VLQLLLRGRKGACETLTGLHGGMGVGGKDRKGKGGVVGGSGCCEGGGGGGSQTSMAISFSAMAMLRGSPQDIFLSAYC